MRLSRKKAIELCIELWTWLAETGLRKDDWPDWPKYQDTEAIVAYCWFCYYQEQQIERYAPDDELNKDNVCRYCPLASIRTGCGKDDSPYLKWLTAKTPKTRKKYAKLFLGQIRKTS